MKIQSAILEGANILKNKSINSAKLDSEILLASAIDKDRKYLILNNDQNVKEKLQLDQNSNVLIIGCEGDTDKEMYQKLISLN